MENKRRILAAERGFRQPESLAAHSVRNLCEARKHWGNRRSVSRFRLPFSRAIKQKPRYPSNAVLLRLFSGFHLNHFHRKHGGFHARHIAAAQTRRGRGLLASGFGYQRGGIGFHKLQT